MLLTPGDKVRYNFPQAINSSKKYVYGFIDMIGENFVTLICEDNSTLKISYKNFDFIEIINFIPESIMVDNPEITS